MSDPPPVGRDEPVEPPLRWTALEPDPPELDDELEPDPLEPLVRGGGADRVGLDCGGGDGGGIPGCGSPAGMLDPVLVGGASLVVVVRGIA